MKRSLIISASTASAWISASSLFWMSLLLRSSTNPCQAYVTSPSALPVHRQMAFLKEMTVNLVQTETPLSNTQLSQAPQLLHAWSKIPTKRHSNRRRGQHKVEVHDDDAAVTCEKLVARIVQDQVAGNSRAVLTVGDYNCLLQTWLRHRDAATAAERCEQIVHTMQQTASPLPDRTSFQLLLHAWRHVPADPSYAPHRALRILEWMMRLYHEGENDQALPDADCFDTVLTIWSRSGHPEAPERTEELLGAMERLHRSGHSIKPGHVSFNAVLSAWAKSHRPEAADRAMKILSFMELLATQHPESGVVPDAASYNTVMGAIVNNNHQNNANHPATSMTAVRAQAVLKHALQTYARNGVEPETILFNSVIGALSKQPGQFHRARSVLDRQLQLHGRDGCQSCPPDVVGYTSVLAACAAEPVHKAKALDVALQTFAEMMVSPTNNSIRPNHITYATMFKACARLLPAHSPTRRNLVRQLFQKATEEGCVGDVTLHRLREAAPADLYKELLQGHGKRHLPASWTRRVSTSKARVV